MSKADKAMGDLDAASSPSGPSSPNKPDHASGFIPHARYGSETPKSMAQDNMSSHGTHAGFMDPVAQHRKKSLAELHHIRSTALEEAETQHGTPKTPGYQHGDPEY